MNNFLALAIALTAISTNRNIDSKFEYDVFEKKEKNKFNLSDDEKEKIKFMSPKQKKQYFRDRKK